MIQRWSDCSCEDYPCCGHYDTITGESDDYGRYAEDYHLDDMGD